jgi:NAD(P)-dependent dehydrogenase (short-subunit alcohol dehydrogenase family)
MAGATADTGTTMPTHMLQHKVAVITGSANGIGRTTALRLAEDGAHIGLLDFDANAVAEVCEEVRKLGREAIAIPLDCTDAVDVGSAFKQVREALGPIDILVNGVGQSSRNRMTDFAAANLETFDFLIAVNLKSCVLCSHQVVPDMKARGSGKIVNIASESAVNGSPRSWDYAAAKAGVIGFTRAVARELAPFRVTVNAVAPGPIRTRAIDEMPKNVIDSIIADIPMGRIGQPEDVANAILFFASSQSDYITGQTLLVNGGHWML